MVIQAERVLRESVSMTRDLQQAERLIGSLRPVSRETWERFSIYVQLLKQWQRRINLVSPTTIPDIWTRHIADSVQTLMALPNAKNWVDIGSGAGFPGLVTAILLAENGIGRVELIESVGKKCAFMNAVIRETGIRETGTEVIVYGKRVEVVLPNLQKTEAISARALASLKDLLTLTNGHLTEECHGVFAKGREHEVEVQEAQKVFDFDVSIADSILDDESVLITVSNVRRIG